jgi:hypothetical protein
MLLGAGQFYRDRIWGNVGRTINGPVSYRPTKKTSEKYRYRLELFDLFDHSLFCILGYQIGVFRDAVKFENVYLTSIAHVFINIIYLVGRRDSLVSVITRSLPSNGSTCHFVPSSLFVTDSLQAFRHFFYSEGCDRPRLTSPGSKPAQVYHHHLFRRLCFDVSSLVSEGPDHPSTMSSQSLSLTRWKSQLLASRPPVRNVPDVLVECPLASWT